LKDLKLVEKRRPRADSTKAKSEKWSYVLLTRMEDIIAKDWREDVKI